MRRTDSFVESSEAQRRAERRAEARLADGLRWLDEAKRYHLNVLTREQRALHHQLIALKTGNRWSGSQPSHHDLSHPVVSHKKTLFPVIPTAGGEDERHRSVKLHSTCSLKARVQEFINRGENRADKCTVPLSLPHLKPQPSCTLPSAASKSEGRNKKEQERQRETLEDKQGQRRVLEAERIRPKDSQRENELVVEREMEKKEEMDVNLLSTFPVSSLSESFGPDGHLRMVQTLPNLEQALAEARNARYIRHRGKPLCERELSISEIFSRNSRDTNPTH